MKASDIVIRDYQQESKGEVVSCTVKTAQFAHDWCDELLGLGVCYARWFVGKMKLFSVARFRQLVEMKQIKLFADHVHFSISAKKLPHLIREGDAFSKYRKSQGLAAAATLHL